MIGMSLLTYIGNTGDMRGGIITAIIYFYLSYLLITKINIDKVSTFWLILIIFSLVIIPRIILIGNTVAQPFDDFGRYLDAGEKLANNDYSLVISKVYIEDFPSLIPWIVFEALVVKIIPANPILTLRIVNCIACGIIGMSIFLLGKNISLRTGILASMIYALYPSSIVFSGVLSCQHLSTAVEYSAFVVLLIPDTNSSLNKKSWIKPLIIGILLGIGQLFRPDALPAVIAILVFIILQLFKNENPRLHWVYGSFKIIVIIISYLIITNGAFRIIQQHNIPIDNSKNAETAYKFYVGFNFNQGKFVSEDRKIFTEANALERKQLLYIRFAEYAKHPLRLLEFLYRKYHVMWGYYSSSFNWLQAQEISGLKTKIDDGTISAWELNKYNRLMNYQSLFKSLDSGYYFLITFFAAIAAWNLSKQNIQSDLFSLLTWVCFCYIGVFFFIEVQERYKYFLMPSLIIFAAYGVTVYDNFFNRVRRLLNNHEHQSAI